MKEASSLARMLRFSAFEVNLRSGELRKNGVKVKLQEQRFQVLSVLLEWPGEVVAREDYEQGLNIAVKKLRDALGDSNPRFI